MQFILIILKVLVLTAFSKFLLLIHSNSIYTQDIIFTESRDVPLKHSGKSFRMNFLVTKSRCEYLDFDSSLIIESGLRLILLSGNACTKILYVSFFCINNALICWFFIGVNI